MTDPRLTREADQFADRPPCRRLAHSAMSDALLLLPDFVLIVSGWVICRYTALNRPVWDGAERLVYYLLFPALLFSAILRNPLQPASGRLARLSGIAVVSSGIALAYALRWWPGVDASCTPRARRRPSASTPTWRWRWPSAWPARRAWPGLRCWWRCACRCATSRRCGRWHARAATATCASWSRNPLILSTGGRAGVQPAGLQLPELAMVTLSRIGAAALPLGLMAVGAGLTLGALRASPGLAAAFLASAMRCCPPWRWCW